MQVFLLDEDPDRRAEYHCDPHIAKSILESVQILNQALRDVGADDKAFYEPIRSGPLVRWAADSQENWEWLIDHVFALNSEFLDRFDSNIAHTSWIKCVEHWGDPIGRSVLVEHYGPSYEFESNGITDFPLLPSVEPYKTGDIVETYRDYYFEEKVPQDWCYWSNGTPTWVWERI